MQCSLDVKVAAVENSVS